MQWREVDLSSVRRRRRLTTATCSRTTVIPVAVRGKRAAAILCKGGVSFHLSGTTCDGPPRRTGASHRHVLNHRSVTHSTVTAIYDRYRYDKEKRAALEK